MCHQFLAAMFIVKSYAHFKVDFIILRSTSSFRCAWVSAVHLPLHQLPVSVQLRGEHRQEDTAQTEWVSHLSRAVMQQHTHTRRQMCANFSVRPRNRGCSYLSNRLFVVSLSAAYSFLQSRSSRCSCPCWLGYNMTHLSLFIHQRLCSFIRLMLIL